MTRPLRSTLPALAAFLFFSHGELPAQTTTVNPTAEQCKKCFPSIEINKPSSKSDSPKSIVYLGLDGTASVSVKVFREQIEACPESMKVAVVAVPLLGNAPVQRQEFTIPAKTPTSKPADTIRTFNFTKEDVSASKEWQFFLECGSKKDRIRASESVILEENGCSSCPEGSASCPPVVNQGCFLLTIPTTASNGGMSKGTLYFYTPNLTFPGRAGLQAIMPKEFIITRVAGLITQIDTGAGVIDVIDGPLPDSITITHKDLGDNPFRTTVVSMDHHGTGHCLRMDSTFGLATTRYEQCEPTPGTTVLEKGRVVNGTFESVWQETLVEDKSILGKEIKRRTIKERSSASENWKTTSDVEETWEKLLIEWVKTKEVIEPGGAALTSTWTYYLPGEYSGPNASIEGLGRLKQYVRYDGYESHHTYALHYETVTTPYAGNVAGKTTTTIFDPGTNTTTVITTVGGNTVSKTVTKKISNSIESREIQEVHTSSGAKLVTTTHFEIAATDFTHKPIKVEHPDGTLTTYSYTRNEGGGYTTITDNGSFSNGNTVSKGTRTTTIKNSRGTTILTKSESIGPISVLLQSTAVTSLDNLGRALTTAYNSPSPEIVGEVAVADGAAWITKTSYSCCGVAKETDMYGISTFYAYDSQQRQVKSNRMGVTTETVRKVDEDSSGKPLIITETHRYPEVVEESLSSASNASAATLVAKSVTNPTGTLQESWSPNPTSSSAGSLVRASKSVTTYKPATGFSTRTVTTTPDNFSQTTNSFLDGRAAVTYGTLSPAMAYNYSVNSTGEVTSQSYVDDSNFRETTTSQSDWAGRTLATALMDGATSTMTYNNIGQLVKSTDPDGVATLFAYNAEGDRTITVVDLNENGIIDYGVDTVSYSETEPAIVTILPSIGLEPVMKTISQVWKPGESAPTVVSTSMRSANGLRSFSQSIGVDSPATSFTVISKNNEGLGTGSWSATSIAPDGTKQVQSYAAGQLALSYTLTSDNTPLHSTAYTYDALNRPVGQTDSRTGTTVTNYLSSTSDTVASVTAPGDRTTAFTYDVRGRRIQVDAPDSVDADNNPLLNVTTTNYNTDSTVAETTGDQTYRTTHTYDYAQRQITMTTYGSTTATTYWHYSPTRGFLTRKAYHDGKGTDYTYTAAGRLSTRGWARAVGTAYAYDKGGRLISTTYSDDTPDVFVAYDCLGRQISQTNGTATTTYSYDPATLALDTETIAYDLDSNTAGPEFTRVIDRSRDDLGRDTGWTLGAPASAGSENSATYSYGPTDGRLASVSGGGFQPPSPFHYTYIPQSNLLSNITGPTHTVTNTWEATRDVLSSKENKVGTTVISGYTYNVNHLGQRTGVSQAGTAFQAAQSVDWGYNSKGEVVKADSSVNASDRSYQYDGIGNRLKSADSLSLPTNNNYSPNALNQYTSLTVGTSGPLVPSYDDDGNATAYPLPANVNANSTLSWDAENRLIAATVNSVTTTYLYDSQSRRIAQSSTINNQLQTIIYLYDGWNPIAEYIQSGTGILPVISKTYTWGMDLSGSMQGAGGVGGLLAVKDTTGSYFPTYDGNGNISEYLDATGSVAAHYEYDPFGKETVSNGTNPSGFAHRFSTKPLDTTTGLLYYGYRYYDPAIGRWPSRDPIEEKGGVNLYGFVGNDGVNKWDLLGNIIITINIHSDWFTKLPIDIQRRLINDYLGRDINPDVPNGSDIARDIAVTLAFMLSSSLNDPNYKIALERLYRLATPCSYEDKGRSEEKIADMGFGYGYDGPTLVTKLSDILGLIPTTGLGNLIGLVSGIGSVTGTGRYAIIETKINLTRIKTCCDPITGKKVVTSEDVEFYGYEVFPIGEVPPGIPGGSVRG